MNPIQKLKGGQVSNIIFTPLDKVVLSIVNKKKKKMACIFFFVKVHLMVSFLRWYLFNLVGKKQTLYDLIFR